MGEGACPYCKEKIILGASICKHCGKKLLLHLEPVERVAIAVGEGFTRPEIMTLCEAECWAKYRDDENKDSLIECIGNCRAESALALFSERLGEDLYRVILEVIGEEGIIDPRLFERKVRRRFSQRPEN